MNPSAINGGGAMNSAGPPPVVDMRTSLSMVGPNQQMSANNNTLQSTTPGIGVTMEFADKIESAYIRTRHNNLRCFPQCGKVHKTKSFCGTPLCIRIRRLDASQLWSIKEIQVFGEFRNVRKAPSFSLMAKCTSKMIDQSNFVKGHLSSARDDFEFTINPPRKWRYRARIAQVLDMHVFTVYVVARETIVAMKDSPSFQVIPIWKADESMLKGDEEGGSEEEGDEEDEEEETANSKDKSSTNEDSTANKKARPSFDDGDEVQQQQQQPASQSEDHSMPTSSMAQAVQGSNKEGFQPKPTTSPAYMQPSSTVTSQHAGLNQQPQDAPKTSNGHGNHPIAPQNVLTSGPMVTTAMAGGGGGGGVVFHGNPPLTYPMVHPQYSPSIMVPPSSFQQQSYFPSYPSSTMTGTPFFPNPLQTTSHQQGFGGFPVAAPPFTMSDPHQQKQLPSSSLDGAQKMNGAFAPLTQPVTTTMSSSFMSDPSMLNYPGNGSMGNGSGGMMFPPPQQQGMRLPSPSSGGLVPGDNAIITNLLASAYMNTPPLNLNGGGMLGAYPGGHQIGPSFMPPHQMGASASQFPYSPSHAAAQMMNNNNNNKMGIWQQSMPTAFPFGIGGGGSQVAQGQQQQYPIEVVSKEALGTVATPGTGTTTNGFPSNLAGQTMHLASGKNAKEKHQD